MTNLSPEEQKEHADFVKAAVANGVYFKDAKNWYIQKYVQPIYQRSILFVLTLVVIFMVYIFVEIIRSSFPIKEDVPVIIRPKDQSLYLPLITPLNDSASLRNVDEAVSKYLLKKYIEKREGYDFRKITLAVLNDQLKYVRNNSGQSEYENYQRFLSKTNPESPIKYYGKDFQRVVNIESIYFFPPKSDTFLDQARNFITSYVPQKAKIRYLVVDKINSKVALTKRYVAMVDFKFSGVSPKDSAGHKIGFQVNKYKVYKVK